MPRLPGRSCRGCGNLLSQYNPANNCQACISLARPEVGQQNSGTFVNRQRLAELRRQRGMTQTVLADRAGVSMSLVHKLEEGRRSTSLKTLYHLADALKVPVSSLLADSPYAAPSHSLGATPRSGMFRCGGRGVNRKEQIPTMCETHDPAVEYLAKLGEELSSRGITSDLITTGCMPRLHLDNIPWDTREALANSEFEDNILAVTDTDGTWRFWWPWIESIGLAEYPACAAERIYQATLYMLTPDDDTETDEHQTAMSAS